jgi:hypothetical protein
MRTDNNTGSDVTEHDRLLKTVKDYRYQPGDNHHHREVLQECNCMHHSILTTGRTTPPSVF